MAHGTLHMETWRMEFQGKEGKNVNYIPALVFSRLNNLECNSVGDL